jgi:LysM repeat protein
LRKGGKSSPNPIKLRDTSNESAQPQPPGSKTDKPKDSMINDDELGFEISPNETKPGKTSDNKDSKPTFPGTKPPATSDVPLPGDKAESWRDPVPKDPAESEKVKAGYHKVVKGDTLYKLSRDYDISVARLKQLNKLTSDDIKIGQLLRVE